MSGDSDTIDIRVLSQLPEPHSVLPFNNLPVSTTISTLKQAVQDALPSRPQPQAQRLICRGRLLVRDGDTLLDVLGRHVIQTREPQSIHLVIRDISQQNDPPQMHAPGSHITGPNDASVPSINAPPGAAPGIARPMSAPGFAQTRIQPAVVVAGTPSAGMTGQYSLPQGFPPMPMAASMHQMALEQHRRAHEAFIANVQRQQQERTQQAVSHTSAAPPDANVSQELPAPNTRSLEQQPSTITTQTIDPATTTSAQPQAQAPIVEVSQGVPPTNTVATPNAIPSQNQRWTFTINSSHTHFQPQGGLHPFMPPQPMMFGYPGPSANTAAMNVPAVPVMTGNLLDNLRTIQTRLDELLNEVNVFAAGTPRAPMPTTAQLPSTMPRDPQSLRARLHALINTRNAQQEQVNFIMTMGPGPNQQPLGQEDVATLATHNDNFRRTVRNIVDILNRYQDVSPASVPNTNLATPATSTPTAPATDPSATATTQQPVSAFLLSGPSGPHAIVYTPSGTFASVPQAANVTNNITPSVSHASFQEAFRNLRYSGRQPTRTPSRNPSAEAQENANGAPAQPQGAAAQQQLVLQQPLHPQGLPPVPGEQAQPAAPENGMDLGIAPFFRALWLFIRAYGICWFFLGGNNNTRSTIFLVILTIAYWGYQAGLFQNQIEYFQRRWEGLVRLPDSVARAAGAGPVNANERLQQGTYTPEEAARRLLEERRQREGGSFRTRLRAIERALVLFVISFWPGGGERLIAERERTRREAEEQRQRDADAAAERDRAAVAAADPFNMQGDQAGLESTNNNESQPPKGSPEATIDSRADVGEGSSSSVEIGEGSSNMTERRSATHEAA